MTTRGYAAPAGTRDILPPESGQFADAVATFAVLAARYGFALVVNPTIEDAGLFERGIGEDSDITRKEMYVFEDRGGRRLALRPEGTASVVRSFVQHHPTTPWKVWYLTPAFRYERPQAGRYKQHHQLGVEALGVDDPLLDAEVIALAWRFYETLGLRRVQLLINSIGHAGCRAPYLELLTGFFAAHEDELCADHQKQWRSNPLRVFDCKNEPCVALTDAAPKLIDHLCVECREHYASVLAALDALGVPTTPAPRLVRGFDYYTRTTFEFASVALTSAQNAVGGGGRYDELVEELGGPPTPGIGFGIGIERLLLALEAEGVTYTPRGVDAFVIDTTDSLAGHALLAELRAAGVPADRGYDGRSLKALMKRADRSGARVVLIIGPDEAAAGVVTMRDLRRADVPERQRQLPAADIVEAVRTLLAEAK